MWVNSCVATNCTSTIVFQHAVFCGVQPFGTSMLNVIKSLSLDKLKAKWQHKDSRALLAKGSIGALVSNVAGAALMYCLHVLLARIMGTSQYGIFTYVLSWVVVLQLLGLFGLPQTVIRFAPAYKAQHRLGLLRGLLQWTNVVALIASVSVACLACIVVSAIPENMLSRTSDNFLNLRTAFYIGAVSLPFIAFGSLRIQTLRAFGAGALSVALLKAVRPLVMIALLIFSTILEIPITSSIGIGLHLLTFFVLGLIATQQIRLRMPVDLRFKTPVYRKRIWVGMAVPSIFVAGMSVVLNSTDRIMIGYMLGTDDAGIYSASTQTAQLVTFGLVAVNAILGPMISAMHSAGKILELQRLLFLAAWTVFTWNVLGSIVLLLFGPFVLALFGPAFGIGYMPMIIMLLSQTINVVCGSVGLLLSMTGHQSKVAKVLFFAAALNVTLNFFLIPAYGMNGAALSTAISMIFWNVIMLFIVHYSLHLNPTIFRSLKLFRRKH